MSRREAIRMTDEEVRDFVNDQRVVVCASNGPRGWPHLMPLWYAARGGDLWAWTYAKSQKTRNLERDPRATLQIEDGEAYDQLRGVMFECDVTIHTDVSLVAEVGMDIWRRYTAPAGGRLAEDVIDMVRAQAPKRVGLQFVERRRATWDHRKLGGLY